MWFPRNDAPNNEALWPIAFVNMSLISAETNYSYIARKRSPEHTPWHRKIPQLLVPWQSV